MTSPKTMASKLNGVTRMLVNGTEYQFVPYANLSDADLSDANLRGANLPVE